MKMRENDSKNDIPTMQQSIERKFAETFHRNYL